MTDIKLPSLSVEPNLESPIAPSLTFQPHPVWHQFGLVGGIRYGEYTLPEDQFGIGKDFEFKGLEYRFGLSFTAPLTVKGSAFFAEATYLWTGSQTVKHDYWVATPKDENPDMGMPGDAPSEPEIESFTSNTTQAKRHGFSGAVGLDLIPPNLLGWLSLIDVRVAYEFSVTGYNGANDDPNWPRAAVPYTADGEGQATPAELLKPSSHAFRLDVGTGLLKFTSSVGRWSTVLHNPEGVSGDGVYVTTPGSTLDAGEVKSNSSRLHGGFFTLGATLELSGLNMPRLKVNWGTDDYIGIYLDGDKDGYGAGFEDVLHDSAEGPLFFVRESRYQTLRQKVESLYPNNPDSQYTALQALLLQEAKRQYPKVEVQTVDREVYNAILGNGDLPASANIKELYELYVLNPEGFEAARKTYIVDERIKAEDAVRDKVDDKLERQGKSTDDDDATEARDAAVKAYADKYNDRLGYLILIPEDKVAGASDFWLTPNSGDCDDTDATLAEDCGEMQSYYPDLDGDGFGDNTAQAIQSRQPIAGHVANNTDCDDTDDDVKGGECGTYYPDADSDNYGNPDGSPKKGPATGYVGNNKDCDDANAEVNPGATDPSKDCDQSNDVRVAISLKDLILDIGKAQFEDLRAAVKDQSYEFRLGELVLKNETEAGQFQAAVEAIAATQLPIERLTVIGKADQDDPNTSLAQNTFLALMRAGYGTQILINGWAKKTGQPESLPELELQFNPSTNAPVRNGSVEVSSERGFSFVPELNEKALKAAAEKLNAIAEKEVNALYLAYDSNASAGEIDTLFTAFVSKFKVEYPYAVVRERNYNVLIEALGQSPLVGTNHALYKKLNSQESKDAIMAGAFNYQKGEQDEHYQTQQIQHNTANTVTFTVPSLKGVDGESLIVLADWETKRSETADDPRFELVGDQLTITLPKSKGKFSTAYNRGAYHFYVAVKPYSNEGEKVGPDHNRANSVYSLSVEVTNSAPEAYKAPKAHGTATVDQPRIAPREDTTSIAAAPTHYTKEDLEDKIQDLAVSFVATHGSSVGLTNGDSFTIVYKYKMNESNSAIAAAGLIVKKGSAENRINGFGDFLISELSQIQITDYSEAAPYEDNGSIAVGSTDF